MVDYRRMGNIDQQSEPAIMSTAWLHHLWSSPRGTVLRIQALALVAITISFFLAAFGSCRRWSNRWIVQKGFLAAQVLSLSLGTYSIGLMQSSSVKSEMYPVWAVALLTLFGCVDPITSYVGLDYKGPLLKVLFQLCLYFGYVLLMSVSTISNVVGNLAIGVLSAITFMKGFHRSLALVVPSRMQELLGTMRCEDECNTLAGFLEISAKLPGRRIGELMDITMYEIHLVCDQMLAEARLKITANDTRTIEDVCLGYFLSHLLQRHLLGLDTATEMHVKRVIFFGEIIRFNKGDAPPIDYKRTLKVIEFELAFLYEVFFTSNAFLQFYEARTSCLWAFASFMGVCFVCVAAATPGTMASHHHPAGIVVATTTADLVATIVLLVSLALLQLLQLVRCWTSNWARVAFACEYAPTKSEREDQIASSILFPERKIISSLASSGSWWCWIRLKAFVVTRMNWFDKYLWQDQLGQYSVPDSFLVDGDEASSSCKGREWRGTKCMQIYHRRHLYPAYNRLMNMLALRYIKQVLRELLLSDTKGGAGVRLHEDVKTSMADFLGQIKSNIIGEDWSSLLVANGIDRDVLPYTGTHLTARRDAPDADKFTRRLMMWHVATWYCQVAEHKEASAAGGAGKKDSDTIREKNRRVAMALSKYCVYLVSSAPELLPGPAAQTKSAFDAAKQQIREDMDQGRGNLDAIQMKDYVDVNSPIYIFDTGLFWGKQLRNEMPQSLRFQRRRSHDDLWKVLVLLWVQVLVCAAPYGNLEAHKQHLSKGGEFITHIWALLYHLGIDRWKWEPRRTSAQDANEETSEEEEEEEEIVAKRKPVETIGSSQQQYVRGVLDEID